MQGNNLNTAMQSPRIVPLRPRTPMMGKYIKSIYKMLFKNFKILKI